MPAIERINSLFDETALAGEFKYVGTELKAILGSMAEVQKGIVNVTNAKGGSGLRVATDELTASQKKLQTQTQTTLTYIEAESKAQLEQIKVVKDSTQYTTALSKEKDKAAKQSAAQQKAAEKEAIAQQKLSSEYNQLVARQKVMQTIANEMGAVYGKNSEQFIVAAQRSAKLKDELKAISYAQGDFQKNVGNYPDQLKEGEGAANKFFGAFQKGYSIVRIAANILPGLGISGIFLLAFEGIKGVIDSLNIFGESTEKAAERQRKLNDVLNEQNDIIKEGNEAYKSRLNVLEATQKTTQSEENALNVAKAQNKSKAEQLELEKKLADARALSANIAFNKKGGFSVEQDALNEMTKSQQALLDRQKEMKDFLTVTDLNGSSEISEKDAEEYQKRIDLAKKEFDRQVKNYNDVKAINEENAAALAAQKEKEIEIVTYAEEQKRKVILESARLAANDIIAANDRVLAKETSTEKQRIAAVKSSSTQRRAIALAELKDNLNDPSLKSTAERAMAYSNYASKVKAITLNSSVEEFKIKEDYRRRDLSAQLNIDKDFISEKELYEKELSTDTNLGLQQRINYAVDYYNNQKQLAADQLKYDMDIARATGKTEKEIQAIQVDYNYKLVQLNADTQRSISSILEGELAHRKKLIDDSFQDIALVQAKAAAVEAESYANDTYILSNKYNTGVITYEKYQRKLEKLDVKYAKAQVQRTIEVLQEQLKEYEKSYPEIEKQIELTQQRIVATTLLMSRAVTDADKDRLSNKIDLLKKELDEEKKTAKAIADLRKGISDATSAANKATAANTKKKRDEELEGIRKIIQEVADSYTVISTLIGGLQNANIEKQKNAIQDIEDSQQQSYERDVERINNSAATQTEKAEQLKMLEAQRQAQKEQNERRQRQLDLQRAKWEKANAIAGIILNTALAIAKALPDPVKAAIAGALGAVQLAVAIATPLPKFATGTDNSPEGLAVVGERGSEGRVEPDGSFSLTPNKASLTWLRQGTKIIPHDKLVERLGTAAISGMPTYNKTVENNDMRGFTILHDAMTAQTTELKKLNKKKTRLVINNRIKSGFGDYLDKNVYNK